MFWKFLLSLLKLYLPTAVSFITASHTLTKGYLHSILISLMLRLSFLKIAVSFHFSAGTFVSQTFSRTPVWLVYKSITPINIQLSRRKINNYGGTVCHYTNLFHWWKWAPKKINIYFDTAYHTTAHYTAQLLFAICNHNIRFLLPKLKTLSAIQKMLVSPAYFSTHPVGQALWEESLILSKIHWSIWADEWNFCPLPSVTVARTRDFTILQSKQQTWQTYGAGEGRVNWR